MATDTTALQERIARAIYRSDEDEMDRLSDDFGDLALHWQRMYLMNAAAVLPIIAAEVRAAKAEALREMQEHHEREADKAQTIAARGIHLTIADGARKRATEYETGDRA